jgi:hypothetical protein
MKYNIYIQKYLMRLPNSLPMVILKCVGGETSLAVVKRFVAHMYKSITENRFKKWFIHLCVCVSLSLSLEYDVYT